MQAEDTKVFSPSLQVHSGRQRSAEFKIATKAQRHEERERKQNKPQRRDERREGRKMFEQKDSNVEDRIMTREFRRSSQRISSVIGRASQSGRGQPHSKTLARRSTSDLRPQGPGLRDYGTTGPWTTGPWDYRTNDSSQKHLSAMFSTARLL